MRKYKRKLRIFLNVAVIALFILSLLELNLQLGGFTEVITAQQAQIQSLQYEHARLLQSTALSIEQIAEISEAVNEIASATPTEITRIIVPEAATEALVITKEPIEATSPLNTKDIVNGGTLAPTIIGTLSLLGKAIGTLIPALP